MFDDLPGIANEPKPGGWIAPGKSWRRQFQDVKSLGEVGWWRVGENKLALAAELIGRNGCPQAQRRQKVGRGQHEVIAAVRAADAAQDETAAPGRRDGRESR